MDTSAIDRDLQQLRDGAPRWARLPAPARIQLVEALRAATVRHMEAWVETAAKIKRLDPRSQLVGEEWISGPWVFLASLDGLLETLSRIRDGQSLIEDLPVRRLPSGQLGVQVLPHTVWDRVLLSGYEAEVWMQPGVTRAGLEETTASFLRRGGDGGVAVVLGAGNISSIAPLDVLYRLFAFGHVVICKLNPVNERLGPIFEQVFAPFVDAGFVRFVYGGADVGAYLTEHDAIDGVHMTGAAATHDAIVFGTGEEGRRRKAADDRRIDVPITSELGGVGPVVVLPGTWSEADLRFQAERIATMKLHNHGCNCIAAQVLVVPSSWPQKQALLDAVREAMVRAADRDPHYPGEARRWRRLVDANPDAIQLGAGEAVPTLLPHVDPADAGQACFHDEAFGPVLAVTELPGDTPEAFLDRAVDFVNDTLDGTLGVNLLVDPATERRLRDRLPAAIARLRYGAVSVNVWTGLAYLSALSTWGAFPGHTEDDIGSGIGVVHNVRFFVRPERTVVRGPFRPMPRAWAHGELHLSGTPLWFVTHRRAREGGRLLAQFQASRSPVALAKLFGAALRP